MHLQYSWGLCYSWPPGIFTALGSKSACFWLVSFQNAVQEACSHAVREVNGLSGAVAKGAWRVFSNQILSALDVQPQHSTLCHALSLGSSYACTAQQLSMHALLKSQAEQCTTSLVADHCSFLCDLSPPPLLNAVVLLATSVLC